MWLLSFDVTDTDEGRLKEGGGGCENEEVGGGGGGQSAGRTAGQQTTRGASRPARLHHTPVLLPTTPQALVMVRQVTQVSRKRGIACVCMSHPSLGSVTCHSILLLITIDLVSFYLPLCLGTCTAPVGRGVGEAGTWGRCFDRYRAIRPTFARAVKSSLAWRVGCDRLRFLPVFRNENYY